MSYLPLAPRQWEHNRQAVGIQPFTDLVRILLLTILTQYTPSDAWGSRSIIMPSPQSWVMVCRDHAVRPIGRVNTCYAVYSVVKVLVQNKSVSLVYATD